MQGNVLQGRLLQGRSCFQLVSAGILVPHKSCSTCTVLAVVTAIRHTNAAFISVFIIHLAPLISAAGLTAAPAEARSVTSSMAM